MLQTLHQLCCPSLDPFQHLNVFLVVTGLDEHRIQGAASPVPSTGDDHFPGPAGHTSSNTSQDVLGLLGQLGTLLGSLTGISTSTVNVESLRKVPKAGGVTLALKLPIFPLSSYLRQSTLTRYPNFRSLEMHNRNISLGHRH